MVSLTRANSTGSEARSSREVTRRTAKLTAPSGTSPLASRCTCTFRAPAMRSPPLLPTPLRPAPKRRKSRHARTARRRPCGPLVTTPCTCSGSQLAAVAAMPKRYRPKGPGCSGGAHRRRPHARGGRHPRRWQVRQPGRRTGRDGRQAYPGPGGLIASSAACTAMGSAGSGSPGGAPPGTGRPVSIVTAPGHGVCVAAICRATAGPASEMSPLLAASRRCAMSAGAAHRSATRSASAGASQRGGGGTAVRRLPGRVRDH